MKKIQKTLSLTQEAIEIGKAEAKKIGLNFSSLVEQLIRKLKS